MASPEDSWRGWDALGGLRLDARLSDRIELHAAGRYTKIDGDLDFQALVGLAADGRTALRGAYREKSVWNEYQSDSFATLSAKTGAVSHRVVAGLEAGLSKVDSRIGIGGAPPLDIYAPVYGPQAARAGARTDRQRHAARRALRPGSARARRQRFRFVPALRWSRLRLEDRAPAASSRGSGPVTHDSAVTPSLGFVFLPRPWLSLYVSGSPRLRAADTGPIPARIGRALAPLRAVDWRPGMKADLLRGAGWP